MLLPLFYKSKAQGYFQVTKLEPPLKPGLPSKGKVDT